MLKKTNCKQKNRRTAITSMLSLGVPEQVVRKISGHFANSKEFYRYVFGHKPILDQSTDEMFKKLSEKRLNNILQPAI